jgi:hypothetical protein
METLVVCSYYYRADDASMSGKMEAFYQEALLLYKDFNNRQLHEYITRKLAAWQDSATSCINCTVCWDPSLALRTATGHPGGDLHSRRSFKPNHAEKEAAADEAERG